MQGARGGGGGRYSGRNNVNAGASQMNAAAAAAAAAAGGVAYGGMPGYFFNPWLGFNAYNVQGLMPLPPVVQQQQQQQQPRSAYNSNSSRGSGSARATAAFVPLAVQGAGILKRPVGPPQGHLVHGRSHSRGHGGRWGRRREKEKNLESLTKEALDADLDEYRMKDKKLGSNSLDADLDEYWKKKGEIGAEEDDEDASDSKSKLGGEGSSSGGSRQDAGALKDEKISSRLSNGHKESKAEK